MVRLLLAGYRGYFCFLVEKHELWVLGFNSFFRKNILRLKFPGKHSSVKFPCEFRLLCGVSRNYEKLIRGFSRKTFLLLDFFCSSSPFVSDKRQKPRGKICDACRRRMKTWKTRRNKERKSGKCQDRILRKQKKSSATRMRGIFWVIKELLDNGHKCRPWFGDLWKCGQSTVCQLFLHSIM